MSSASARAEVSDVEVRRLYQLEGWTAAEFAAQLGCGTSRVYARLQRLGVPRRGRDDPGGAPGPRIPSCGVCTWERGLSLHQLAERFSVSPQALRGWLDGTGVPRRGHEGRTSLANSADVLALCGRGWWGPCMAARSGCSAATYRRRDSAGARFAPSTAQC